MVMSSLYSNMDYFSLHCDCHRPHKVYSQFSVSDYSSIFYKNYNILVGFSWDNYITMV